MYKLYIILLLILGSSTLGWTQAPPTLKNPKKLVKDAAEYEKSGDYFRAAVYYEAAYSLKEDKADYIYDAGRCYLEIRDYANAAKCLEKVKDKNKDFDKPGYKYAISLKQNGQYNEAKTAFTGFISSYNGDDKLEMKDRVETEIKGCNFALKAQDYTDPTIFIKHLPTTINTDKTEFAPIPFGKDVLYFSSAVSDVASIYRTKKVGDKWSPRQSPSLFMGKMEKPHFGNGTFTPDGKRFYFTQCNLEEGSKPMCEIYLMTAKDEGGKTVWSQPVRLPDYINAEKSNTTHPFVVVEEDKEILYFASNREGGKGGLDLWYCTRTISSNGHNFTLPKNLGRNINTPGNEITPFYHPATETLYFSSDGRINAGGLDIFKSKGAKLKWEVAENLGFPVNSAGDDLYYVISEGHGGGYLVSNRRSDPHKVSTTNDDIFHFVGEQKIEVRIEGMVYAESDPDQTPLEDIRLQVFEMVEGTEELVKNKRFSDGRYEFILEGGKDYLIELSKPDSEYSIASFEVKTNEIKRSETIKKDIGLKEPEQPVDPVDPPVEDLVELYHRIVPPEYDSKENPYELPYDPPIDPETGEPFAEGTAIYDLFLVVDATAQTATDRKVYYNDLEKENIVAFIEASEPDPVLETAYHKNWDKEDYKEEAPNVRFKIQVAAVRYYKESRYKELQELAGVRMAFEPIEGAGLTRILIVPDTEDNEGQFHFLTKADALDALIYVTDHSKFKTAFVSRYIDDERTGEGFRGWEEETEDEE
ncbi:MAG: outer membrane peptidoglycan-associated protein [Saprospiraceae bacterium]|nr:outer membrane peptidoglycan-associated protein [Saprospiraceae bacterium]